MMFVSLREGRSRFRVWPLTAAMRLVATLAVAGWAWLPAAHAQNLQINLPGISVTVPNVSAGLGAIQGVTGGPNFLLNNINLVSGATSLVFNQVATVGSIVQNTTGSSVIGGLDAVLNGVLTSTLLAAGAPSGGSGGSALPAVPAGAPYPSANVSASHLEHSGLDVTAAGATTKGPDFRENSVSALPGVMWDASSLVGASYGKLKLGVLGGYVGSDISFGATDPLRVAGISRVGSAVTHQGIVGGYGLWLAGNWYGAALVAGGWGEADLRNSLLGAEGRYTTSTLITALTGGVIVPTSANTRLDLRSQLVYMNQTGDAHRDSVNIDYGASHSEVLTGIASAKLFAVIPQGNLVYRPFVQLGASYRFHEDIAMSVGGVDFKLGDAPATAFATAGLDVELGRNLQTYVAVRGDASERMWSATAQIGLLFKLD